MVPMNGTRTTVLEAAERRKHSPETEFLLLSW